MKMSKQKLLLSVVVLFSLIIFAGNSWALPGLPHAGFGGYVETKLDGGAGDDLALYFSTIDSVVDSVGNPIPADSIIGAEVTITGAKRNPLATPGTTFSSATMLISDGTTAYFTATLINIEFEFVNGLWRLNPSLDPNIPSTLNLIDIVLDPGPVPSDYILDLQAQLGSQNIAGMTMTFNILSGDITGDSFLQIFEGILDGVPPPPANVGPTANAGITDSSVSCAGSSCEVLLNGTDSSDPDDGIEFYEWYDASSTLIATGVTAPITLPLGMHDITLKVIDFSGEFDTDTITIVVDPAELSFIQIDKAHVKKDGKVKIRGRLSLPAGVSHLDIDSVGRAIIGISDLAGNPVIDESVDFIESADGNKWKYNVSPTLGIKKFRIDWTGSKYNYQDGGLTITTDHIGDNETELVIISCLPYSITVGGVTITRDENGVVTASDPATKVDGDDDGDSDDSDSDGGYCPEDDDCIAGVRLPFALTPDMSIDINGTLSSIGDGYTAAVGKFKIHGRFDVTGIVDFSLLVPILDLTVTLGTEEFYGRLIISDDPVPTWTKIKPKYWKYRAH